MAFITLRRLRGTRSYYLVESYRDDGGRSRKRTLCYLGREQDGTDTLARAIAHWEQVERETRCELRSARGEPRRILQDRVARVRQRLILLRGHAEMAAQVEAGRLERQRRQQAQEEADRRRAEEAEHWQAIERLQRNPSDEHAQTAKRAYRMLALRLHPDQGGSHEAFIRLKNAYDRAAAAWRRRAG
jgi:hypothetical protein